MPISNFDPPTQEERREIAENDRRVRRDQADALANLHSDRMRDQRSTLLDHALASANDLGGGRFAALGTLSRPVIVGSGSPVPQYPKQPDNSPWARQWEGPEPPLGQDVNYVEPVEHTVLGEPGPTPGSQPVGPAREVPQIPVARQVDRGTSPTTRPDGTPMSYGLDQALGKAEPLARRDGSATGPTNRVGPVFDIKNFVRRV
jgi:hypothetical protein